MQTQESVVTFPGRPLMFLEQPEKGTLPFSCSFRKYDNNLYQLMYLCSHDLRGGAGVKVILDNYIAPIPCKHFDWRFKLDQTHPDYDKLTEYQKSRLYKKGDFPYFTYLNVADSMEDGNDYGLSIEYSWCRFIELAKDGRNILVDLSKLRPNGTENEKGLTATGPIGDGKDESNTSSFFAIYDALANYLSSGTILSFLQVLGTLNSTLRRGGQYKNGIITSSMRWDNSNVVEYLNAPLVEIPGSHKKSIKYDRDMLNDESLLQLISDKRNSESVFLEPLMAAEDLHANVCMAIFSKPSGVCIIGRVNTSQCRTNQDIIKGLVAATIELCKLHVSWRDQVGERANLYLPLVKDRQIGVDILGFANLLSQREITYLEFTDALESWVTDDDTIKVNPLALDLVKALCEAYELSTEAADKFMLERGLPLLDRIHTIEPSQSHAFKCFDLNGYTTARSIFAPMGRKEKRVSDSQKIKVYNHGAVETAVEVGGELHQRFIENWQRMMNRYGRPHAISFDTWLPCTVDWLKWFVESDIQTAYYQFAEVADQSYLSKQVMGVSGTGTGTCDITLKPKEGCSVCGE